MDIDFNNPSSSSFGDSIIAEKLGLRDSSYNQVNDMNSAIQVALLQQELERNKRQMQELEKLRHTTREHFDGGCGCGVEGLRNKKSSCKQCQSSSHSSNNSLSNNSLSNSNLNGRDSSDSESVIYGVDKRILLILVIVLAAFCIVQYFSYKSEMKEMMMILCAMLNKSNPSDKASVLQSGASSSMLSPGTSGTFSIPTTQ